MLGVSVIILAAGESKRFGQAKQLLVFGNQTLLERATDTYLHSKAGQVVVVLGHKAREIAESIKGMPVTIVINDRYGQGMSTSIAAGLSAVNSEVEGIMLALADQPLINIQTINLLIDAFSSGSKGIIIPVYNGTRGNPVIFDIKYKDQLLGLKGDIGGREIVKNNPSDILEVPVDCEGILFDIDTEESYKRFTGK
jgi:molybdenum cofactor cytidylyltransferase